GRGRLELETLVLGDLAEPVLDRLRLDPAEVKPLAAGDNRTGHPLSFGCSEHENGVWRRLLEGLEERVPGRRGQLVGLVDDVNAVAHLGRREGNFLPQLTDVVDPTVRGRVDLHQVEAA